MFTVTVDESMLEKLRGMLEDEDEGTCVRLREYKVGGGAARMLGISMPWSLTWMGWGCPSSGTRCTR